MFRLIYRAETAALLAEAGIPTTVILDSAIGFYMEQVSMVIAGAEGVVENGGIVNSVRPRVLNHLLFKRSSN